VNDAFEIAFLGADAPTSDCSGGGICFTEQCDPGTGVESGDRQRAKADGSYCDLDCSTARCGDQYVNQAAGEECDPEYIFKQTSGGNNHAGCDSDCTFPACGDGLVNSQAGEDCEPNTDPISGVPIDSSSCDADCTSASCGDGYTNEAKGETCDDGDNDQNDGCNNSCQVVCGDGNVWTGSPNTEECDSGGANAVDCDADCTLPVCGDNLTNTLAGEQCDDGNIANGDGCDENCQTE
jgi:cysteine-rich repeat protein